MSDGALDHGESTKFRSPEHPSALAAGSESSTAHEATLNTPQQSPFLPTSTADPSQPGLNLPPFISSLPPAEAAAEAAAFRMTDARLPDIDPVSLSLHRALRYFRPLNSAYAAVPYAKAFNWSEFLLPEEQEREWYCVAFRSRRRKGSNSDGLYEADRLAHEEAIKSGGLLMYWYGEPDPNTGLNLATCIWQSHSQAKKASQHPRHVHAMSLAHDAYDVYTLEQYVLRKKRGSVHVSIAPYEGGGDVGS